MRPSQDMLRKLINFFVIRAEGQITKIQLAKFIYLADLYAVKWTGTQLTELKWYRYHFGPWHEDIQTALKTMDGHEIRVASEPSGENAFALVRVGPEAPTIDSLGLPKRLVFMLENIHREWPDADKDVKNLLNYVYATEPMKAVIDRLPDERAPLDLTLEQTRWNDEANQGAHPG